MKKTQKKFITPLLGVLILLTGMMSLSNVAAAQTSTQNQTTQTQGIFGRMFGAIMPNRAQRLSGTITAKNGTTLTITADQNHGGGTFTIDATKATITKDGASATIDSFTIGDTVWATGTESGTTMTATTISNKPAQMQGFDRRNGDKGDRGRMMSNEHGMRGGMMTPGPGGPGGRGGGVMGTVTAINGTTITITGQDGKTHTINAGGATVQRMVQGTLSDVAVGHMIGVHGTASGTTITAQQIMDGITPPQKNH